VRKELINEDRIRALVRELDEAVPRDGKVVVTTGDADEGGTIVRANQLGYLKLGIQIMRGRMRPPEARSSRNEWSWT